MKVVTAEEIKKIEQIAIKEYGISELILMENAGVEVSKIVKCHIGDINNKKIVIFAGKGNNGGDAFVVARHLANQGAKIKVFILGDFTEIIDSAAINLSIIKKMNIDITALNHERDWDKMKISTAFADCIVDGLIGTGFIGELREDTEKIINLINNSGKDIISIDLPSGVETDNGKVSTIAVKATKTVTFSLPKIGLILYPGTSFVGELFVADIGIPRKILDSNFIKQSILSANDIKDLMPERSPEAYKGSVGKVLVIAGSRGMTGAATLTVDAAMRAGAGKVTLAIGESLHAIMEMKLTEVMTTPLQENDNNSLSDYCFDEIKKNVNDNNIDSIIIGPGLGRQDETLKVIRNLISDVDKPFIIDADGLSAINGYTGFANNKTVVPILTPHLGEFSKLIGITIEDIKEDIIFFARQAAKDFNSIIVLKGPRTVVAAPNGDIYINTNANEGMATAGSGDVLAGIIGSFLAQGLENYLAAVTGVFIHGFAGDIVACNNGKIGMIAGDITNAIPGAIAKVNTKRS